MEVIGDVLDKNDSSFVLQLELKIQAGPAEVFDTFVNDIGNWWDSSHTYSGDAKNLTIDARPGGCFCESFPTSEQSDPTNGAVHMSVAYVQKPLMIRLLGGLGPLQEEGAQGAMTIRFEGEESHTNLKVRYTVIGRNLENWADPVNRVVSEQLERLKNYVESDSPERTNALESD